MTKDAFENAIAVTMALGGSTNAVLHLLAIANEAHVDLELDDFNRIGARVPHVADMKPHGKYHMVDLDRIGGVPVVMEMLLEAGLLHGDCVTVTGRTLAENLRDVESIYRRRQEVVRPLERPLHPTGHLVVLHGNLAPEAVDGGPIALVADGDRILIDAESLTIDLVVDAGELARRKANWKLPEPRYTSGFLAKYARLAQGAEKGAITNL